MILRTSKPSSPTSDMRFTTTVMRRAATIVSPSKRSVPTSVSPLRFSDALGKLRSRLMSSFSKSSRAASIALASRLTMSPILPRSSSGVTIATTSTTATTVAVIFRNLFIFSLF